MRQSKGNVPLCTTQLRALLCFTVALPSHCLCGWCFLPAASFRWLLPFLQLSLGTVCSRLLSKRGTQWHFFNMGSALQLQQNSTATNMQPRAPQQGSAQPTQPLFIFFKKKAPTSAHPSPQPPTTSVCSGVGQERGRSCCKMPARRNVPAGTTPPPSLYLRCWAASALSDGPRLGMNLLEGVAPRSPHRHTPGPHWGRPSCLAFDASVYGDEGQPPEVEGRADVRRGQMGADGVRTGSVSSQALLCSFYVRTIAPPCPAAAYRPGEKLV